MSYLSYLPFDLFTIVCSFLDLETKCRSFPKLSRHFNSSFKPDRCCRGEVAIILPDTKVSMDDHVANVLARARYVPYASSLELHYSAHGYEAAHMLHDVIWSRVDSGCLESIKITERHDVGEVLARYGDLPSDFLFVWSLLSKFNGLDRDQLQSLQTLVLSCQSSSIRRRLHAQLVDWSVMRNGCQSLRTLHLRDLYNIFDPESIIPLFDHLPSSLTSLKIELDRAFTSHIWLQFCKSAYLPQLHSLGYCFSSRRPTLEYLMEDNSAMLPNMQLSEWMTDPIAAPSCLNWCFAVHSVKLQVTEPILQQLVAITSNVFPMLKELCVTLECNLSGIDIASPLDLSRFFMWLPRQLTSLKLRTERHGTVRQCTSISRGAVQALTSMSSLKLLKVHTEYLHFENGMAGSDNSAANIDTLVSLTSLSLKGGCLQSPSQLVAFLRMNPHIQTLQLNLVFSVVSVIPAIPHLCPSIVSISCDRFVSIATMLLEWDNQLDDTQLSDLLASIRRWPLSGNWFLHLQKLHFLEHTTSKVIFTLCCLLRSAPKLTDVMLNQSFSILHIRALCMLPHITHLSCDFGCLVSLLAAYVTRLSCDSPYIDPVLAPSGIAFWKDDNNSRRKFRTLQDSPPLDGRKAFASMLLRTGHNHSVVLAAELERDYEAAIGYHVPWYGLSSLRPVSPCTCTKQCEQVLRRFSPQINHACDSTSPLLEHLKLNKPEDPFYHFKCPYCVIARKAVLSRAVMHISNSSSKQRAI